MARRTKAEITAWVRAVLWHAFKSVAGKEAGKAARDLLAAGDAIKCDLVVQGQIGDRSVEERLVGTLQVNHDQATNSSIAANTDELVGLLLEEIPKKRRLEILARWPEYWSAHQSLPAVDEERKHEAEQLLKQLRSRQGKTARGSVVFARESTVDEAAA